MRARITNVTLKLKTSDGASISTSRAESLSYEAALV